MFVRSVYRFHLFFHVQIPLHHLGISLTHKDDFRKVKNSNIKRAHNSICDDYSVNADKTWINVLYDKHGGLGGVGKTQNERLFELEKQKSLDEHLEAKNNGDLVALDSKIHELNKSKFESNYEKERENIVQKHLKKHDSLDVNTLKLM